MTQAEVMHTIVPPSPSLSWSLATLCPDGDHSTFSRLQGRKAASRGKSQATEGGLQTLFVASVYKQWFSQLMPGRV